MAVGVIASLILLLCVVFTQQTDCNVGQQLILVINKSVEIPDTRDIGEVTPSPQQEGRYVDGSSRGECIVLPQNMTRNQSSDLNSFQACQTNPPVGFCNSIFTSFFNASYSVTTECTTNQSIEKVTFTDQDQLCCAVSNITGYLSHFTSILDRTLVNVYSRSCSDKSICLEAYMQWLCAIRLPLFKLANQTGDSCNSDDIQGTDGNCYTRFKPCLDVCHSVLQKCPYYLPSKYQFVDEFDLDREIIFGGYPAFACPRDSQVNESSYSVVECLGSGAKATVSMVATFTPISILFTMFLLCVYGGSFQVNSL